MAKRTRTLPHTAASPARPVGRKERPESFTPASISRTPFMRAQVLALLRRQNARSTRSVLLGAGQTAGIRGLSRLAARTSIKDDTFVPIGMRS
jgi:hypothetical protein